MPSIHSRSKGSADVVMGLQYGDEGKGRIVDDLIAKGGYDWVARFNGGANAGHTVEFDGKKIALHQIPSGVTVPNMKLYIGSQCVVNPVKLCQEIRDVEEAGIESVQGRLRIAAQASIIQPGHIIRDCAMAQKAVGTTGNGIGPAYADQASRIEGSRQLDLRMGDYLVDPVDTVAKIKKNLDVELERCGVTSVDVEERMQEFLRCMEELKEYIEKDPMLLTHVVRQDLRVLLEGAQAFGLDKTFGISPNITASNTGVAAAFLSSGIPVDYKGKAYGVMKLIPSRVGHGPFVTEFGGERSEAYCMEEGGTLHTQEWEQQQYGHRVPAFLESNDPYLIGIALRILGNEYGATTKRPRRLGAFDAVQVKHAADINGLDGIFATKADRITDFAGTRDGTYPVAVGYKKDGTYLPYMPTTNKELRQAEPLYMQYPAFAEDISAARLPEELNQELTTILSAIQDRIGTTILGIGVGPGRGQVVPFK